MQAIRRPVLVVLAAMLAGLFLLSLGTGLWLRVWVPTKGKAWLAEQLQRQLHLTVTIGRMEYALWDGLRLEKVRGVDPASGIRWLEASHLHAHLGLLNLVLRRQLTFRLSGQLLAPCQTDVALAGRMQMRTRDLSLDVLTSEIALDRLSPPLAERLPPALKGGVATAKVRLDAKPDAAPLITGHITVEGLVWEQGLLRLTTNLVLDGATTPNAGGSLPWAVDLTAHLDHGHLEGLPLLQDVTELSGVIQLVDTRMDIHALHGIALGAPWELEGTLAPLPDPQAELIVHTRLDLTALPAQVWPRVQTQPGGRGETSPAWQASGQADVTAVCRGPLRQWPHVELMAEAILRDASVAVPSMPQAFEHIAGRLSYDHLTSSLTIESLSARYQASPLTLQGRLRFTTPVAVHLTMDAETDLAQVSALLPPPAALTALAGPAAIHLEVDGPSTTLSWQGRATMSGATLRLKPIPHPIEQVVGTIRFSNHEVLTDQLAFTIDHEPVILDGAVTNLPAAPRVSLHARLTDGSVSVLGTAYADRFLLETADITLGSSHLLVQGEIGATPKSLSQLRVSGTLEPSDLTRLPWLRLDALKPWRMYGATVLQLQMVGPLGDWNAVSASGTLSADTLSIRELPFRAVRLELEQGQGRLSIRLTNAFLADGKLLGQYLADYSTEPARSLLEFDLTQADLAQVAEAIPAWRNRHINGALSGHASFLGTWADRNRLSGDGWLRANGEHLADIPLLDQILRGFFGALADRLGLAMFRSAQITELSGQWRVLGGRVDTKDFRLGGWAGTEPIAIYLRGSVGLDGTLDLTVEPELSEQLVLQAPTTATPSSAILKTVGGLERLRRLVGRHHLGGTIEKPDYKFEFSLDQLLNQLLHGGLDQLLESIR